MRRTMGSSKVQGSSKTLGIPQLHITDDVKTQILDLNSKRFNLEDRGRYVSRRFMKQRLGS